MKTYGLTESWEGFIDSLFDEYFAPGFTEDLTLGYSKNQIISIIGERLDSLIFDIFMRDYINIDKASSRASNIVSNINDIFYSGKIMDVFNDFNNKFLDQGGAGIIYFMEYLSQGFFISELTNIMNRGYGPSTFHGAILEANVFFNKLPSRVADLYKLYSGELTFYSYADLVPNNLPILTVADFNTKLVNDFNELENKLFGFDTSLLNTPSKGRSPDLGVYDFLNLVLSNHLKNTWNLDAKRRKSIGNEITTDALTAQLLDFYTRVEGREPYFYQHINDLYSPLTYGEDVTSQRAAAEGIAKQIFSKTTLLDLIGKVSSKHLYFFKVTELINNQIEQYVSVGTSFKDTKEFIIDSFSDPDFQLELYELTEKFYTGSKLTYILDQGSDFYIALETIFTDNLNALMVEYNSKFTLMWGADITYYFDTDIDGNTVPLTRNLLPPNTKILKVDQENEFVLENNGNPVLESLTDNKLNRLLSRPLTSLMIAHDKHGSFIVFDSSLKNRLPKGIFEGYLHQYNDIYEGQTFHGIVLNREENLLFGRVQFAENGEISILNREWFNNYLKFIITGETISFSYYTYFGHTTGNYHVGNLQETTTNLIPTKPYEAYLPWVSVSKQSKQEALMYPSISSEEKLAIYGEEFTRDKFNKIFSSILLSKRNTQETLARVTKFLEFLNGNYNNKDFLDFQLGRSIDDVDVLINELISNKNELLKLIWKDDSGNFRYSQTFKEWLKLIYDKIVSYTGSDSRIKVEKSKLNKLIEKGAYSDLDISTNRDKFTTAEANIADEIFKSVNNIFGHFTIRSMFANMISYYKKGDSVNQIGLKITSATAIERRDSSARDKLSKYFSHLGFIPPTSRYGSPIKYLSSTTITIEHLFSYFFLDSSIELDLFGNTKKLLTFNRGPLVAVDTPHDYYQKSHKYFSVYLASQFSEQFNKWQSDQFRDLDTQLEFFKSQTNLFTFLVGEIEKGKYIGSRSEIRGFIDDIISELRRGLFSTLEG
ncbi:MAG TPA: hypothetical protein ENI29_14230, partial [bacterium]|nr:hypothetical protein [bacterium]